MDDDPSMNPGAGGPGAAEKAAASGLVSLQYAEANRRAAASILVNDIRNAPEFKAAAEGCNPLLVTWLADAYDEFAGDRFDLADVDAGGKRKKRKGGVRQVANLISMTAALLTKICSVPSQIGYYAAVDLEDKLVGASKKVELIPVEKLGKIVSKTITGLLAFTALRIAGNELARGEDGIVGITVSLTVKAIIAAIPREYFTWVPGTAEIVAESFKVAAADVSADPQKYVGLIASASAMALVAKLGKAALDGDLVRTVVDNTMFVLGQGKDYTARENLKNFVNPAFEAYIKVANASKIMLADKNKKLRDTAAREAATFAAAGTARDLQSWFKKGGAGLDQFAALAAAPVDHIFALSYPGGPDPSPEVRASVAALNADAAEREAAMRRVTETVVPKTFWGLPMFGPVGGNPGLAAEVTKAAEAAAVEDSGAGVFPPRPRARSRGEEGDFGEGYEGSESDTYEDEMGRIVKKPGGRRRGGTRRKARRSFRRSMRRKSHRNSKKRMNKRK